MRNKWEYMIQFNILQTAYIFSKGIESILSYQFLSNSSLFYLCLPITKFPPTAVNVSSNEPYFGIRDLIFYLLFSKKTQKILHLVRAFISISPTSVSISISFLFCGATVALFFFLDYSKSLNYKYLH